MWTRAGDHHMVDRSWHVEEESLERGRIFGVESRGAERANLACGTLQSPGVSRREDNVRSLRACPSRRFEPNAGASANHDDGLSEEFRFALGARSQDWVVHDSSDQ
jgi:hypothetical protein